MVRETENRRRDFLKLAAFGVAGLATAPARGMYQAQRETIQRPGTPQEAVDLLVQGNQRYVAQNSALIQGRSGHSQSGYGRTPGTICCCPFLRRLPCARRAGLRSEHWSYIRGSCGRQHCHAGHHRQPGIWSGRAGGEGPSRAWAHQLRRGEGHHRGQGGTRTDQHVVSIHPSSGRRSGRRPDQGLRAKCHSASVGVT